MLIQMLNMLLFAVQNHLIIHVNEPGRVNDNTANILDQFVSKMNTFGWDV